MRGVSGPFNKRYFRHAEERYDNVDAVLNAKRLEVQGVKAADGGDLDEAMSFFNQAVAVAPSHPAGYNNRAQVLRLKGDDDG